MKNVVTLVCMFLTGASIAPAEACEDTFGCTVWVTCMPCEGGWCYVKTKAR